MDAWVAETAVVKSGVWFGLVAVAWCGCTSAWASAPWGTPAMGALGAHEHGVADLSVAIEGQRVDLILSAPSADLVGLERAPASGQEHSSVQERVTALETGDWFLWEGGRCQRVSVEVTLPARLTPAAADAEQGAGAGEGAQHAHEHHGDHDDQDEGADHGDGPHEQEHMDGTVHWQYRCEPGIRLRRVDVRLFESMPLQRIRAQVVSEWGQAAGDLTPRSRQLSLP